MMINKAKKIQAFKELLKISKSRSFDIYETTQDLYVSRSWPIEWDKELCDKFKTPKDKQNALDKTLMKLTLGDFPQTTKQMEQARKVIQLTLLAGANPNYSDYQNGSIFDSFWYSHKGYGLLELVKDDRFETPEKLQGFYESFHWKPVYCCDSNEEIRLNKKENENRVNLIYTLFQKGMYPQKRETFEKLVPIVLEKDPDFFNKRKEQTISQLKHAKTPIQIFNALRGRKEKTK